MTQPIQSNRTSKTAGIARWVVILLFGLTQLLAPGAGQPAQAAPLPAEDSYSHSLFLPIVMDMRCMEYTQEPYFQPYQWDMRQINAPAAWEQCRYGRGIIVAVVDTGVYQAHPDLAPNLLSGYDFVGNDANPDDDNGHGTHVSGTVAAALNGTGILGVAPEASLLPIKVLDSHGQGEGKDDLSVIEGIGWAVQHGAKVINLSLGRACTAGDVCRTSTLYNAVKRAAQAGTLIIAAAGNDGKGNNQPMIPAAWSEYVMAVASVDSSANHVASSNSGSYVDVAAPGDSIFSTYIYNNYGWGYYYYDSGTSMATPHVSGLAALIWSQNPGLTAGQVRWIIENSAKDLGTAGKDPYFGYGLIQVDRALQIIGQAPAFLPAAQDLAGDRIPGTDDRSAEIKPGVVLVSFDAEAAVETVARMEGVLGIKPLAGLDGYYQLQVTPGQEWQMIDQLRATPGVRTAEPDYRISLF